MRHRLIGLFLALGVVTLSIAGIVWCDTMIKNQEEALRVQRSEQQILEQQVNLLQTPDMTRQSLALEEDLDALRIRLVEALTQIPQPVGVLSVDYEQAVLSAPLGSSTVEPVSVLRLQLTLTVQHAIGFLNLLQRIDEAIVVWPHETQACRLQRMPQNHLQVSCALDFYHWGPGAESGTVRIGSLVKTTERAA